MDLKRKIIEDFKRQIDEGKFATNNDLVIAIRNLYNDTKLAASNNPLLEQFLSENNYMDFTKEVTSELVEYYKEYKEKEKVETTDLNAATIEGQTIDSSEIAQVNTGDITYYTVKDSDGDYKVFESIDNDIIKKISAEAANSEEDITHIAKEVIEEEKKEVNLTGLEQFERQRNLSTEDHMQAALARSMQTYTGDEMAVNADHNVILNTESGELSKIDQSGKVMTYGNDSVEGPSMSTGEQFTLSNDTLDTLSVEDIDMMLADPDKYNLSPETIEGLKKARESKAVTLEEKPLEKEIGFQKVLKPPVNFRTSAFIDVLLVALVSFGFSALALLNILFY